MRDIVGFCSGVRTVGNTQNQGEIFMLIQESLMRGNIDVALLHLLHERDMYGYELVQEMKKRSGGLFVVKDGSMYPVMYRMIERGVLAEEAVLVGKRRIRKYYHLTPYGLEYLEEITKEYYKVLEGMDKLLNYKEEKSEEK